jgi:quinohemoprotein ethanol dehydrogenase
VRVNWASRVDPKTGRPEITGDAWYEKEPKLIFPSSFGGHNWMPMSFSPKTGLAYIPTIERGMIFGSTPSFKFKKHHIYQGITEGVGEAVATKLTGGNLSLLETKEFLKAWDPVTQKERWRMPLTAEFNGGVLSTAGDLVVQGQANGHLVVRRAEDGTVLKDLEIGTGIMAAPMTYAIDGEQYVAVMAGYGGGLGSRIHQGNAAYQYENYPRVIALKLGGKAVPLPAPRVEAAIPAPPPIEVKAETAKKGGALFGQFCTYCHGASGDVISAYPDLTRLALEVHQRFRNIVLGGDLVTSGMANFSDVLTESDVDAIHAYLIAEQRRAYEAQGKGRSDSKRP